MEPMRQYVTVIPSLHEMAPAALAQALGEVELLKAQLLGHLTPSPAPAAPVQETQKSKTWTLTAKDVMDRTGMSRSWLYKNAHKLPFAVRPNGRNWRFSEQGLERYMRESRAVA
jgi:predicted DNA-binding transcriptional regulator AlpA